MVTGISTGFIGSFTTFSTFNLDTLNLFFAGEISKALVYVFISLVGGIFLVWVGNWLGKTICNFITGVQDKNQRMEEKH